MSPLVVDIQLTIRGKIIDHSVESEISTFNGEIVFKVDHYSMKAPPTPARPKAARPDSQCW